MRPWRRWRPWPKGSEAKYDDVWNVEVRQQVMAAREAIWQSVQDSEAGPAVRRRRRRPK